ncbi:MAG: peptidase MA family metallohydrolase, partial [Anaerolineales bacterium]
MDRRNHLLVALLLGVIVLIPRSGQAQVAYEIIPEEPEYTFGDRLNFRASLQSAETIDEVLLFIQISDESDLQVHPVSFDGSGNLSLEIDLREFPLVAFSNAQYWYQINSVSGDVFTSPRYSFYYADNRYQWRTLTGEPFMIHWYQGDLAFGEDVLNVALEGLRSTQDLLEIFFPSSLDIYVYDSAQAVQTALPISGQNWIAGHADPMQGVILVSLPTGPEQLLEMARQIPHELMHIALNYTDSHAYANLPAWFNEGLASLVELYPNPEYQVLIESAYESEELLALASLCQSFPNDPQGGFLAYAESASFTQFLYDQYGRPGLNRLMAAYASGMSCERG